MKKNILLVGHNEVSLKDKYKALETLTRSVAFDDLKLSVLTKDDEYYHALSYMNSVTGSNFSNYDFLWPVISYLGSYLDARGYSFDYVPFFKGNEDVLSKLIEKHDYDLVAITTTVYVSPEPIFEVVNYIKKISIAQKIVVGGPFVNSASKTYDANTLKEILGEIGADYYINSSEGEESLTRLIDALSNKLPIEKVYNLYIYDAKAGSLIYNGSKVESNSLEETPINYSLFKNEQDSPFRSIRTAKSCPYMCSFCSFPQKAGKYTYTDVSFVREELSKICSEEGTKYITFIDDTFNVPKNRFKKILRMIIEEGFDIKWNSYLRSDSVDDEVIDLMKRSGCIGVFLGIESGSSEQLKRMNKKSTPTHYMNAIRKLKNVDILTYASFIIGFPGESYETVRDTVNFINDVKPDFYRAQVWYADNTTPIVKEYDKYGVGGSGFSWSHNSMSSIEASDIVMYMFENISASTWVPQEGFDVWSIYLLIQKGWDIERIKSYLKAFNNVVGYTHLSHDKELASIELGHLDNILVSNEEEVICSNYLMNVISIFGKDKLCNKFDNEYSKSFYSCYDSEVVAIEALEELQLFGLEVALLNSNFESLIVAGNDSDTEYTSQELRKLKMHCQIASKTYSIDSTIIVVDSLDGFLFPNWIVSDITLLVSENALEVRSKKNCCSSRVESLVSKLVNKGIIWETYNIVGVS